MHGSPAIVFYPSWLTPRSIRSSVGRSRCGGFELSHIAQLAGSAVTRPYRQLSGLIHKLIKEGTYGVRWRTEYLSGDGCGFFGNHDVRVYPRGNIFAGRAGTHSSVD